MLRYFNVVFVLEYLRSNGVSQKTQDKVLALLWKEANAQREASGAERPEELPELVS